jgi:tryptophanyl-tRNA synthetase
MDTTQNVTDPSLTTETESSSTTTEPQVVVTPWAATGNFTNDAYKKLIKDFGVEPLSTELLERFEKLTGHKPHRLLRRGIFFAHRHFEEVLNEFESGRKIFIYTGRGPTSDALHLGHIVPIEFTAWLQKVFNAFVIFQMADDEKYWFKNMQFDEIYKLGFKNAADVIAMGYDPEKTFIFSNRDYSRNPAYQKVAFDIMKHGRMNDVKKIFGLPDSGCVGQMMWPIYQTTAAFAEAFEDIFGKNPKMKCLVAYAIDQDPYFRLARDVAPALGYQKPCSLMCKFLPALEGDSKMSSTTNTSGLSNTIFMNDDPSLVEKKIMKFAFSGGQDTVELHRKLGGNPDVDISFQWLRYFEEDDEKLKNIEIQYREGKMLTGELKKITSNVIVEVITQHQKNKATITNELITKFYDSNKSYVNPPINYVVQNATEQHLLKTLTDLNIEYSLLEHAPITTMTEGKEIMKNLKGIVPMNLLLKDNSNFYLLIKNMKSKLKNEKLATLLGTSNIQLTQPDEIQKLLNVPKGCTTVFGLLNESAKKITVLIDESIGKDDLLNFHPLRNNATLTLKYNDMVRFVNLCGNEIEMVSF